MALVDWIPVLLRPSLLLLTVHFFMTILEAVFVHPNPSLLFNLSALREKSFGRLWINNDEAMSVGMPGPINVLLKTAHGVVLDVGPGSGEQLSRFDPAKIGVMHGAEPNIHLLPGLLRIAEKVGFDRKYRALQCGGEPESLIPALAKAGALKDVPRPEETIQGLYRLLKPGGRLIVCEHLANPWRDGIGSFLALIFQAIYALLGWSFWLGGCNIDQDTAKFLRAGARMEGWAKAELEYETQA
ncbi:uncharacterized protein K441DRAFT_707151 [Cenococcum geophilum 1.58]|uniref:uncharacterized protein n=1 Tax=Cenococcum geophilum 1.58 TaxID=794803 RepID=UPI00358F2B12|nr:hypothetical protein K441DRAFT_707151 [Cenococcum geophilum 1.58]